MGKAHLKGNFFFLKNDYRLNLHLKLSFQPNLINVRPPWTFILLAKQNGSPSKRWNWNSIFECFFVVAAIPNLKMKPNITESENTTITTHSFDSVNFSADYCGNKMKLCKWIIAKENLIWIYWDIFRIFCVYYCYFIWLGPGLRLHIQKSEQIHEYRSCVGNLFKSMVNLVSIESAQLE